jgi:hypothetical protein
MGRSCARFAPNPQRAKADTSTLPESGHFYFALTAGVAPT